MIEDLLTLPAAAITYLFGKRLTEEFRPSTVFEASFGTFDFEGHAAAGLSSLEAGEGYHQWLAYWHESVTRIPAVYACHVAWEGHRLRLFVVAIETLQTPRLYVVADSVAIANGYFAEVSRWSHELRSQILVFEGGAWHKDEKLFESIASATFANIVLAGDLAAEIVRDIDGFFASRELYARYRIPWKRGILFIGPPGNGKTHAVKAILNRASHNCIYVKTFDLAGGAFPQAGVSMVFERARATTPCIVVLEDLDSLVGPHNRSFFLNELDGFASNEGIVVLATTNHPERLDAAIIERPSRFDRKYPFLLPGPLEREAYIRQWNAGLESTLRIDDEAITEIVGLTDDFSFAYLRELFLSSLMRWISDGASGALAATLGAQVAALREQMTSAVADESNAEAPGAVQGMSGLPFPPHVLARMMQGRRGSTFIGR